MFCYVCAEKLADRELFCRRCGSQTILPTSAKKPASLIAVGGYFAVGAMTYVIIFLAAIALITLFAPQAGSPQLAMLLLAIFGVLAAGTAGALFARSRANSVRGLPAAVRETQEAIPDANVLGLPDQRATPVPSSVVESTTNKLHVPGTTPQ